MAAVHNPVFVGFVWRQAFDLPAGALQVGDAVRADFRQCHPSLPEAVISVRSGAGITTALGFTNSAGVLVDRVTVEFTEAQTRGLRPLPIFGSGEQTRTLTHVDDIADGIVTATGHDAALNEDFNISASDELTVAEIAKLCWRLSGNDPDALVFEHLPSFEVDVVRRWPSVAKAEQMLGWKARIGVEEGIEATVAWLREREGVLN